jgi:multidrug transporter EmrE-like cation transporter
MNAPWFDANMYAWIPGTLLGVLGGLWGSLCGMLIPRGKGRALVIGSAALFLVVSVALLALAIYALTQGQPYGVWYGLGLPGLIGSILFGMFLPMSQRMYTMVEQRKLHARDAEL